MSKFEINKDNINKLNEEKIFNVNEYDFITIGSEEFSYHNNIITKKSSENNYDLIFLSKKTYDIK